MKRIFTVILAASGILATQAIMAQDSIQYRALTLPAAFDLALNNSAQLKVGEKYIQLARQQTEIDKLYTLPGISTDLNYGYISNADIWTPSFSQHQKGAIPHQFTQLTVQAAEVIFKGNTINNTITKGTLEEQIATLNQEKNTTDIKFLVAARYLDIYRLINQTKVYINNTLLARHRLDNILSMQRQGMVTDNDILRTQLTISDLELTTRKINNNIDILNHQLNMVLGLPAPVRLMPDTTLLRLDTRAESLASFIDEAYKENHELKIAATENKVALTNIQLLKGERMPEIAAFAGSSLQRPYLNNIPAYDIFFNVWQAGISLHYNISSIYQSTRKIRAGQIALENSRQKDTLQQQNVTLAVTTSFIRFNESKDELETYRRDLRSAQENYRIVEKKYFNQLALLTDMLDASNTKIEAELKVTNAEINIIYTWYQLQRSIGRL